MREDARSADAADAPNAADAAPDTAGRNRLLRALPLEVLAAVRPHLEAVTLAQHAELFGPSAPPTHAYFPETLVVSLMADLPSERPVSPRFGERLPSTLPVEVGTVGCEGMTGLAVFLRGGAAVHAGSVRAVAQIPGAAQRMEAARFVALSQGPGPLHDLLLRYTHAFLLQVARTAACNVGHGIEARCARWLLMTRDRVACDEFPLTLDALAGMLGARRAGASVVVRALAAAGLVQALPGGIRILDRPGLEAAACTCYEAGRAEYARVLPEVG